MGYIKIWVHLVWTTKNREPILTQEIRRDIFSHIRKNAEKKGIYIDFINGHVEHVHCLISLGNGQTIDNILRLLKGESSFWINKNKFFLGKFEWQDDYFAVSVSESVVPRVREYIKNQVNHHKKKSFNDEYQEFLHKLEQKNIYSNKKDIMDALIFIDTNIILDFYRIRNSDMSLEYLDLIEKNQSKIIITTQVEMEYKKNRQRVILESIKKMKAPNWDTLTPPVILSDTKSSEIIKKTKDEINCQQKKLKESIDNILKVPSSKDVVFQTLQRLFKNGSSINLDGNKKERFTIHNRAKKRFILGYPPRKKEDNSIGDAINWEWIIKCAIDTKKNIIIVTRDSDYGIIHDNNEKEGILNDWLFQEFKERISQKRKIILTDRLAWAFEQITATVSKDILEKEDKLIEDKIEQNLQINQTDQTYEISSILKESQIHEYVELAEKILGKKT